jgi:hypothetical protein
VADDKLIATGTGTNFTARTKDVGGVDSAVYFPGKLTRSDTYTSTANGTTVDSTTTAVQSFGLQVKGTGAAATSWTVVLEGSLDGTTFTTILTHTSSGSANADGATAWSNAVKTPCIYFRSRCSAVTLGSATNIVATIVGM